MGLFGSDIVERGKALFAELASLDTESAVETINAIRAALHEYSPFAAEPVDCVQWLRSDEVHANDYNPNSVAPPEMRLLEHSIAEDGYTQPIVAWRNGVGVEVVDGFHRNRVGKESPAIRARIKGYLPVTIINRERTDRGDRIAATIRHNRARGKHRVEGMSDIVIELKRRNWTDERIARELGMDQDEILRLCQITGLADLFADQAFSRSWDVEGEVTESDFKELSDESSLEDDGLTPKQVRTVNTSDPGRIFHTHEKWECHKAGFYASHPPEGMTKAQCEQAYRDFLADPDRFGAAADRVITEWRHSCEHYLTNVAMNRIAWIGQAAMCYATGVPSEFRSGYFLLSTDEQKTADGVALVALNKWLVANGRAEVTMEQAYSYERQSDIY